MAENVINKGFESGSGNGGMRRNTRRRYLLFGALGLSALSVLGLGGFANAMILVGTGVYVLRSIRARGGVLGALRSFVESDPTRDQDLRRETDLFNNLTRRWDLSKVPIGLELEGIPSAGKAVFSYNGISGAVRYDDRVLRHYSIVLKDESLVKKVSEHLMKKGLADMVLMSAVRGGYKLSTKNAGVALEVASVAFAPCQKKVEMETNCVQRYCIDGCNSFEEAMEKCRKMRESGLLSPRDMISKSECKVDGKLVSSSDSGYLYNPSSLPYGSYLVDVITGDAWSDVISVKPDNAGVFPEDLNQAALDSFHATVENQVKDGTKEECLYKNPLEGLDVKRSLCVGGSEIDLNPDVSDKSLYCVMKFDSLDDMKTVVDNGDSLVNATVYVESTLPEAKEGEYILAIPADEKFIRGLEPVSESVIPEMRKGLPEGNSVSDEDLSYAYLMRDLKQDGYFIGKSTSGIDFSRAEVNGIPYSDLSYQLQENPYLQEESFRREWMRDQQLVNAVSMSVDATRRELVVTSEVLSGSSVKRIKERYSLRPDEMVTLNDRLSRNVSLTDMKDVVMRSHPELFPCYKNTLSTGDDPVMEFIRKSMSEAAASRMSMSGPRKTVPVGKGMAV